MSLRAMAEEVKRRRESQQAVSDALGRIAGIQSRTSDLRERSKRVKSTVAAARVAGLPVQTRTDVVKLSTALAETQSNWAANPDASALSTILSMAGSLDDALSGDVRSAWAAEKSDKCSESIIGLLSACADLHLANAERLHGTAQRLAQHNSGTETSWKDLRSFSREVEQFIAETTGGDEEVRRMLQKLVTDGLELGQVREGPFRDWLQTKGLDGRLKVTIR